MDNEVEANLGHHCAKSLTDFLDSLNLDPFAYQVLLHGIMELADKMNSIAPGFLTIAALIRAHTDDVKEQTRILDGLRDRMAELYAGVIQVSFQAPAEEEDVGAFMTKVTVKAQNLHSKDKVPLKEAFKQALDLYTTKPCHQKMRKHVEANLISIMDKIDRLDELSRSDPHVLAKQITKRAAEICRKEGVSKPISVVQAIQELVPDPEMKKKLLGDLYLLSLMGNGGLIPIVPEAGNE